MRQTGAVQVCISAHSDGGPQKISGGVVHETRHAHNARGCRWQIRLCICVGAAVSISKVLRKELKEFASVCISQEHKQGLEGESACVRKFEFHPPGRAVTAFQSVIVGYIKTGGEGSCWRRSGRWRGRRGEC